MVSRGRRGGGVIKVYDIRRFSLLAGGAKSLSPMIHMSIAGGRLDLKGRLVQDIIVVLLVGMVLTGCISTDDDERIKPGDLVTDTSSQEVGTTTKATFNIDIGVGSLTMNGGSTELVEATFKYNIEQWIPPAKTESGCGLGCQERLGYRPQQRCLD
jgi:hypothetical protein